MTANIVVEVGELERERELRESEDRYRIIFNAAPIGISISDLGGRLISTNLAFQRMLGYSAEELAERTFMEITHPDDLQADLDLFHQVMTGKRPGYDMIKRYIRKDGQIVWVRLTVAVLRDADGTPTFDLAMAEDFTERRAYEEQLRRQALYDALTELPNRTLLHDRLQRAIVSTQREGGTVALLVLDLDHFKHVNDALGHPQGDELLRHLAQRLVGRVRASDTVARLHGDEFALVLSSTDAQGAIGVARKLQRLLERPFQVDSQTLRLEVSIGIAVAPEHGNDPELLLRRANIALYAAKRGRSGYAVYTPEQEGYSAQRLMLTAELRDAIDHGRLALHFQPKVDVRTGQAHHAEALVRWPHPARGLVLPSEFIPLAEETGLINALSKRVLAIARGHYEEWRGMDLAISIAINLSARNLQDRGVHAAIETMFRRDKLPPGAVEFEITETGFLEHSEDMLVILERFHELGARIVIDDFGTGYSSLAYLARLPVDEIKIDRSFVGDMRHNDTHRVIVQSTIDLAHNLGLVATAEGVEDSVTLDVLAEMGCDMVQGYYISGPLPADAFVEWITRYEPKPLL